MLLLTWHGTLVCLDEPGDGLVQLDLAEAIEMPRTKIFELPMAGEAMAGETIQGDDPVLGPVDVVRAVGGRGVHIRRAGRFLCAEAGNRDLAFDREQAFDWETFLPITRGQAELLANVSIGLWIERDTRRLVARSDIRFLEGFRLGMGRVSVDLAEDLAELERGAGGAARIEALNVPHPDGVISLVAAHPRGSPLLTTGTWPVRARRLAENLALAAHRHVAGSEPTQSDFDRDVAYILANDGSACLHPLLDKLRAVRQGATRLDEGPVAEPDRDEPDPAGAGTPDEAEIRSTLFGWAMNEMAPWQVNSLTRAEVFAAIDTLNETSPWVLLYRFENGGVSLLRKPEEMTPTPVAQDRGLLYLAFFRDVAALLPADFTTTICMSLGDKVAVKKTVPVFGFQKARGERSVLLPDIDFLQANFHTNPDLTDTLPYEDKRDSAVFVGSTSGGAMTPSAVRDLTPPRLAAAAYFEDNPRVDFRLPAIVQCPSPEAQAMLRAKSFCQKPRMSWKEQFENKFLISIDGNGATCSRVAIALRSNSVLMKYDSIDGLFYFTGLQPWRHYVPITQNGDVDGVLDMAARDPGRFARIAADGAAFAEAYLTRARLTQYTAMVFGLYAESLLDGPAPDRPVPAPRPQVAGSERSESAVTTQPANADIAVKAHVQNLGDSWTGEDGWTGQRGSGLCIEGLSIHPGLHMPAIGLSYLAAMDSGAFADTAVILTAPAQAHEYVGSRGINRPMFGIRIWASQAALLDYDLTMEVTFVDGSRVGPLVAAPMMEASSDVAMEAIRLGLKKKILAGA